MNDIEADAYLWWLTGELPVRREEEPRLCDADIWHAPLPSKVIRALRRLDPTIRLFGLDRATKGLPGFGPVTRREVWKWSWDERDRIYKLRREAR